MLKLWNEIKKLVKEANPTLNNYEINFITKIVYAKEKAVKGVENKKEELLEEVPNWLAEDFWKAHKKAKKESNIAWAGKQDRTNLAIDIVKTCSAEAISRKFGNFAEFVIKQSKAVLDIDSKSNQLVRFYYEN